MAFLIFKITVIFSQTQAYQQILYFLLVGRLIFVAVVCGGLIVIIVVLSIEVRYIPILCTYSTLLANSCGGCDCCSAGSTAQSI